MSNKPKAAKPKTSASASDVETKEPVETIEPTETTDPSAATGATDETEATEPKPNLIFVGLKHDREPVDFFTDHERKIKLPAVETQVVEKTTTDKATKDKTTIRVAVPFYHDEPELVVRALGKRMYKFSEPKGGE